MHTSPYKTNIIIVGVGCGGVWGECVVGVWRDAGDGDGCECGCEGEGGAGRRCLSLSLQRSAGSQVH